MGVDLLKVAVSGLNSSKKALDTTGHNIANANTEGFSRQHTVQKTGPTVGIGHITYGTGSRVTHITRDHDPLVEKQLNSSITNFNYHKERSGILAQVEDIFVEIDEYGLNKTLNDFFNSFRDLANQPENETIRSVVREKARTTVQSFQQIRHSLDEISHHMGTKVQVAVEDINTLVGQVAKLNRKINQIEVNQGETGDLRDQRDLAVKNIAEFFELHTYVDEKRRFVVHAKGIGTLVAGDSTQEFSAARTNSEKTTNGADGAMEVYFGKRKVGSISDKFRKGTLGGLYEVRNTQITKLQKNLDKIAFNFVNAVNAIHTRGHRFHEGSEGRSIASLSTGINFFQPVSTLENASREIDLSDEVKESTHNIITALNPNSPGDNRVALAISKLQHEKILAEGTTTLEEEYLKSIGDIGLEARKSRLDEEHSNGLLAQINAIKERISGVSLDEEAANMVKFQHAFEASAKVIQTADEMFKSVLAMKQ
jgi:flagellar hook-associated protein 1 FlgK